MADETWVVALLDGDGEAYTVYSTHDTWDEASRMAERLDGASGRRKDAAVLTWANALSRGLVSDE